MQFTQVKEVLFGEVLPTDSSVKRSLKGAINSLYEQLRDGRIDFESVGAVYFRFDTTIDWAPYKDILERNAKLLRKLAQSRFPRAKLFLLFCSDFQHILTDMRGAVPSNSGSLLEDLRGEELSKIILDSGAIYEGNRYHYFRLPSGRTSDFFLRVGNCLSSMVALNILTFWSLPALRHADIIICDTWSISTLGMHLARIAERYSGKRYECEYLSKYLSEDIDASIEVEGLLERADASGLNPIFLISALSSGRILQGYLGAFDIFGDGSTPSILALFQVGDIDVTSGMGKGSVDILCDLRSLLLARGLEGVQDDFKLGDGKRIFPIDSISYFPQYFEPRVHKFKPTQFAKNSSTFFERYAGRGLFSVCRDGVSNKKLNLTRHHAFHIDVEALVRTEEFKAQMLQIVQSTAERPTHIVHLTKAADRNLAELIVEACSEHVVVEAFQTSSFKNVSSQSNLLGILNDQAANVWFIDAMFISGQSTAQDFEQGLREGLSKLKIDAYPAKINYFVGVLRPNSRAKVDSDNGTMIKLSCPTTSGSIGVWAVETILLPNWDDSKCPWCAERRLHSSLLEKYGTTGMSGYQRDYIQARIDYLSLGERSGLETDLFFKRYPKHSFVFNDGSFWFDIAKPRQKGLTHSEADAMLAIASAIQHWRDDYGALPPAQFLLDQQTAFGVNVYNETFLRSAIWRSLKTREVDTYFDDKYLGELLKRVFDHGGAEDGKDEFVLGWEAARILGRYLPRVLGEDAFEAIEWEYLKWTALSV